MPRSLPISPLPAVSLLLTMALHGACAGGEPESSAEVPASQVPASESSATAAGGPERSAGVRTLGTLQASLGGEDRTWYVVAGEARDGPYASGMWMELPGVRTMVVLGGLDSERPPSRPSVAAGAIRAG